MSEATPPLFEFVPSPLAADERLALLDTAIVDTCSYLRLLKDDPNEPAIHQRAHALLRRAEEAESIEDKVDVLLDTDALLSVRKILARYEGPISQRVQDDRALDLGRILTQAIEAWIDPAREVERLFEAVQQAVCKFRPDTVD